jgi:large subunit ribosomal protein L35
MMPKVKTHSGAKKRFKKLKSGLIKAARPLRRHLLTKKSAKRKRRLRTGLYISTCDRGHIAPLLPY